MIRIEGYPREIIVSPGNEYHDRVDISITVQKGSVTPFMVTQLMGHDKPSDYSKIVVGTCLRPGEYPQTPRNGMMKYLLEEV